MKLHLVLPSLLLFFSMSLNAQVIGSSVSQIIKQFGEPTDIKVPTRSVGTVKYIYRGNDVIRVVGFDQNKKVKMFMFNYNTLTKFFEEVEYVKRVADFVGKRHYMDIYVSKEYPNQYYHVGINDIFHTGQIRVEESIRGGNIDFEANPEY